MLANPLWYPSLPETPNTLCPLAKASMPGVHFGGTPQLPGVMVGSCRAARAVGGSIGGGPFAPMGPQGSGGAQA